jgi:hypothetical protein
MPCCRNDRNCGDEISSFEQPQDRRTFTRPTTENVSESKSQDMFSPTQIEPSETHQNSSSGIRWQVPLLARTRPRKFWSFEYSVKPIANMFDSAPSVSNAVEQVLMNPVHDNTANLTTNHVRTGLDNLAIPERILGPFTKDQGAIPPVLTLQDEQGLLAKDLTCGTVEVELTRSDLGARIQTWESALSLDKSDLKPGRTVAKKDFGYIIPLVEVDLLCLLLFDLLHADCLNISRFLRLWAGTGGCERGVLVEWCTDKKTTEEVR